MNIYCCLTVEDKDSLWYRQIVDSLIAMGHTVTVPSKLNLRESWHLMGEDIWSSRDRGLLTQKILEDVKQTHQTGGVDLFFCYLFPFQFDPTLFQSLDELSIPSLYFFCDNLSNKKVAAQYAPYATLNWVPEKEALQHFEDSNSNYIYLPMAANPRINFPVETPISTEISFIGSKNPYRRNVLGQLLVRHHLNVEVYGNHWNSAASSYHQVETTKEISIELNHQQKIRRYVRYKLNALSMLATHGLTYKKRAAAYQSLGEKYDTQLSEVSNLKALSYPNLNAMFSASKISLGINDQFNAAVEGGVVIYSKLREFEATMAGACYLTQMTPEIPSLFEIDEEIMTYSSVEELADKANFLLSHESCRNRLKLNCRKRALAEHTWSRRFQHVFELLGLKA